jgi:pimeloyl-ACP methyl ester carboxylesterase
VSWERDTVAVEKVRLNYYRRGRGVKPVVLAHGITDNGLCWSGVAAAMEADYDLVAVDARGHGLSDRPESGYGVSDHARDLAGLIRDLALERPALMGHSMGADSVAVLAADYPELVGCLILEDPPWRADDQAMTQGEMEARAAEWKSRIAERRSFSLEKLARLVRSDHPSWPEEDVLPWAEAKMQVDPKVVEYIYSRRSWKETVKLLQCPVLLITADPRAEAIVTPDVAKEARELNPRVEVIRIEGAGHSIRRDQNAEYVRAVRGFLNARYILPD